MQTSAAKRLLEDEIVTENATKKQKIDKKDSQNAQKQATEEARRKTEQAVHILLRILAQLLTETCTGQVGV